MLFDFEDYSGESGEALLPLLISERSQALLLAAVEYMQHSYAWVDGDDTANFDNIDEAVSSAISEIILEVSMDGTPIGTMMLWVGEIADIPEKWLLCNDNPYDGDDYPELYAILPDILKDGMGNFRTPAFADRFPLGVGATANVGEIGGENEHILTIAEMPAHTHTFLKGGAVATQNSRAAQANNTALGDQSTSSVGGGAAHNNMPMYIAFNWIIKALP